MKQAKRFATVVLPDNYTGDYEQFAKEFGLEVWHSDTFGYALRLLTQLQGDLINNLPVRAYNTSVALKEELVARLAEVHPQEKDNPMTNPTPLPPIVDEKARDEFAHRYNTVVYEIWSDGWKQGYEQGQESARQQPTVADLDVLKSIRKLVEDGTQSSDSLDGIGMLYKAADALQSLIQQKEGQ